MISNCLTLSTSHASVKDVSLVHNWVGDEGIPWSIGVYPEGFFISFSDLDLKEFYAGLKTQGYSEEFIKVFKFAIDNDCYLIRFDCDGTVYSELETFDW